MSFQIEEQLRQLSIFPVMGERLNISNSMPMDFTESNEALSSVDLKSTAAFNDFIFDQLSQHNKRYGYGGYLEKRVIYKRSEHFQQGESRNYHLGIDIWSESYHPVYSPLDAVVHSYANNDHFGDYGPTIILSHQIQDETIYTLYGHLSLNSLENIFEGKVIRKGEKFCELGPYPENGDWPPHLHFQVMTDMLGKKGDFPGVCSASELNQYKSICLDPLNFIS